MNTQTDETISVVPLCDRDHPRLLARKLIKEHRQKSKPILTQADIDENLDQGEPLGVNRKFYWKSALGK